MHVSDALDTFLSDPRIRGRLKPSTFHAIGGAELRVYFDQQITLSPAARRLAARWALFAGGVMHRCQPA